MDVLTDWLTYVQTNFDFILEETINHARISLTAVAAATVVAVLLGVFIQPRPLLRAPVQSIVGIFLTIPSLALFALFVPLVGIGNSAAIAALFLYALLPILRNTVAGLDAVSPAVVESAKGMGMNRTQLLLRVRLPLAYPVIMAGVRVSTLLAVSIAAIAALVGGDGLGTFIDTALGRLGLPNSENQLWTGTIFIVLLGLVLDIVLATVQRFTTPRGLKL
ncbi:ABC transporter permease [Nocardioides panacisoli]|uniref:ABC transporter permease n=1 Tax=Nocardioides panacisoli TaxID=627624 RepID=UPI001C6292A7|nr:ABC transporter permease [Nocardioides panacisoli]QYJ04042.1 ABC transporter permease [Nocardioides panacisoli]